MDTPRSQATRFGIQFILAVDSFMYFKIEAAL